MLRDIISKPEGPFAGFVKGAGATFVSVGIPIVAGTLFMHGGSVWEKLEISGAITAVMCIVAGTVFAIWRLLQGWAYSQIANDPN